MDIEVNIGVVSGILFYFVRLCSDVSLSVLDSLRWRGSWWRPQAVKEVASEAGKTTLAGLTEVASKAAIEAVLQAQGEAILEGGAR